MAACTSTERLRSWSMPSGLVAKPSTTLFTKVRSLMSVPVFLAISPVMRLAMRRVNLRKNSMSRLISSSFQSVALYSLSTMERTRAALTLVSSSNRWKALDEMARNCGARMPATWLMMAVL